MKDPPDLGERPEVALAGRTPAELVNLIKKLRWIGMEEEAARIQILLRRVTQPPRRWQGRGIKTI